jgi:hypothetical protein
MKHNILVAWVVLMPMFQPSGRIDMDLNTSRPFNRSDLQFRIVEVGTCIGVLKTGIEDDDVLTVTTFQIRLVEVLELPDVMKE